MTPRYIVILLAILCLPSTILAQSTFNTRFIQDFDFATIRAVAVTDTAYYASGPCGSEPLGSAFYTFDLEGNLTHTKFMKDSLTRFELWTKDLIPTERGSFLTGGYAFNSITDRKEGVLVEYFPALDSVRYHLFIYDDPTYIDKFGAFFKMDYKDEKILLSANVNHPDLWNSELVIFHFNLDFELLDIQFIYHTKVDVGGIVKAYNGSIYLLSYLEEQSFFRYSQQVLFREFNHSGLLLRQYLSPDSEIWGRPGDFLQTTDNGFLLAGSSGYQYHAPWGTDSMSVPLYTPYILKLSEDLEREWTMTFGQGQEGDGVIEDVCEVGGEYIVTGSSDYLYAIPENFRVFGIVAKVTQEGEKIWDRRLHWMDTINHKHTLRSIAPTADGGFLLGGQVKSYEGQFVPGQRAWLLKVDEYGCMVPGCQGPVGTTEANGDSLLPKPLLYPNPANDLLSIFIPSQEGFQEGTISITDAAGREVHQYEGVLEDATYLMDVTDFPAGIYYLRYFTPAASSLVVKWVKG